MFNIDNTNTKQDGSKASLTVDVVLQRADALLIQAHHAREEGGLVPGVHLHFLVQPLTGEVSLLGVIAQLFLYCKNTFKKKKSFKNVFSLHMDVQTTKLPNIPTSLGLIVVDTGKLVRFRQEFWQGNVEQVHYIIFNLIKKENVSPDNRHTYKWQYVYLLLISICPQVRL